MSPIFETINHQGSAIKVIDGACNNRRGGDRIFDQKNDKFPKQKLLKK